MWTIYKVLFEFVAILFLFYVLVFWPWGMWGLSPTRNWTYTPCIGRQNLSHWTAKEVPKWIYVLNADFLNSSLEVKWSEVAQSCPNLCDPMDCSLPGFSAHGIFQARVLEWVAISFSSAWKWKWSHSTSPSEVKSLSRVWLFATPWTVAYQAPLSMGFSRQYRWSGLPFPSPADLPDPGIEPRSPAL